MGRGGREQGTRGQEGEGVESKRLIVLTCILVCPKSDPIMSTSRKA